MSLMVLKIYRNLPEASGSSDDEFVFNFTHLTGTFAFGAREMAPGAGSLSHGESRAARLRALCGWSRG